MQYFYGLKCTGRQFLCPHVKSTATVQTSVYKAIVEVTLIYLEIYCVIILLTAEQLNNLSPFLQKSFQCYQKCSIIVV